MTHGRRFSTSRHWDLFFEQEIPLEVCLSSNRCTMVLQELDTHHFRELYQAKHPVVLCVRHSPSLLA